MALKNISKRQVWITIAIVLLVLIFLNPSYSDFKAYVGYGSSEGYHPGRKRTKYWRSGNSVTKEFNFVVCSVYKANGSYYLGLLKNFIPL